MLSRYVTTSATITEMAADTAKHRTTHLPHYSIEKLRELEDRNNYHQDGPQTSKTNCHHMRLRLVKDVLPDCGELYALFE